jgi:quinone-modifying oxidoreductase subunit QmoB
VVLYTDLRVPGMGEDFYRSAQNKGVIFAKGKAAQGQRRGSGCAGRTSAT